MIKRSCWFLLGLTVFNHGSAVVAAAQDSASSEKIWLPGATGSGPYDVAVAWSTAFSAKYPELYLTLSSVGSGAAQKALWGDIDCEAKPVDAVCENNGQVEKTVWGLGDAPVEANVYDEQPTMKLQQLPACAGAITIVYSIDSDEGEQEQEPLNLTFDVLAGIFNRSIAFWDDPRIRQLNPTRPSTSWTHQRIAVLVRQDSSGQTSIVTDALDYNVDAWPDEAVGKKPVWPLGTLIRPSDITTQDVCTAVEHENNSTDAVSTYQHYHTDGKTGVAKGMLRVPYSIGYMEMGSVAGLSDFLAQAKVGRSIDTLTSASAESLRIAMGGSAGQLDPDTLELNLARAEMPAAGGGYPISGYAYWYIKRDAASYTSCYQAWLMCKFVEWAYTDPQATELGEQNGWVVPPEQVVNVTLERLQDVMCIDTEVDPPIERPAMSYTPPPYRFVPDDDKIPILLIVLPSAVAFTLLVLLLLEMHRRRTAGDHLWKVSSKELIFSDPPEVIGAGTFGNVTLADYRGTRVAVKKALPSSKSNKKPSPTESAFVTSVIIDKSTWGFTGKSKSARSSNRAMSRQDFIEEMRVLAKLRHPCITTGTYRDGFAKMKG